MLDDLRRRATSGRVEGFAGTRPGLIFGPSRLSEVVLETLEGRMLTAEQLDRLADLIGQAQSVLKQSNGSIRETETARRRVAAFLEEGVRLCGAGREASEGTTAGRAPT